MSQNITVFSRLIKEYVKPYRYKLYIACALMVVVALCSALSVQMIEPAINTIMIDKKTSSLFWIPLAISILHIIKAFAEYIEHYLVKSVGYKILSDLQMKMFRHLIYLDIAQIYKHSSSRLVSRFTNDISLMRFSVSHVLVGFAKHSISIVFLIIVMFKLEPQMSCVILFVFPISIYHVQKLNKSLRKVSSTCQENLGHYTSKLDESFRFIKLVKSYVKEEFEIEKAQKLNKDILTLYKQSSKLDSLMTPITEVMSGIVIAGVIFWGGYAVINGYTTTGSLFAFIAAFVSAYRPFKSVLALNTNFQEGLSAAKRIFAILDTKPLIVNSITDQTLIFTSPNIVFDKVSMFIDKHKILDDVSFEIPAGKMTAIVGQSGSGKTSIAHLIMRLYDIKDGSIKINGCDIKNINLNTLRGQIAYSSQDVYILEDSVVQNIKYGASSADLESVIMFAKLADAHEFIATLPQGYETNIGSVGVNLSGGQNQRIALARALIKDAPILILDEATSSLDVLSENSVLNKIKLHRLGKTTIVITHRIANVQNFDHILVVKSGSIIESGTHFELLQNKSEYFKLHSAAIDIVNSTEFAIQNK